MCAKKQGLTAGFREWLMAASCQIKAHVPSMPEAEALRQLFTTGQKSQASQAVCSRFVLATQPSHEVKSPEHPVWQNMTFHILLTLLYIYPYTHDSKRTSGEDFKRETLEKIRLTHPQSLPKRLQIPLLSSSPLSNP